MVWREYSSDHFLFDREIIIYGDGEVNVLSPVDAKQIAGRAGRYLSPYPHGEVTTYVLCSIV